MRSSWLYVLVALFLVVVLTLPGCQAPDVAQSEEAVKQLEDSAREGGKTAGDLSKAADSLEKQTGEVADEADLLAGKVPKPLRNDAREHASNAKAAHKDAGALTLLAGKMKASADRTITLAGAIRPIVKDLANTVTELRKKQETSLLAWLLAQAGLALAIAGAVGAAYFTIKDAKTFAWICGAVGVLAFACYVALTFEDLVRTGMRVVLFILLAAVIVYLVSRLEFWKKAGLPVFEKIHQLWSSDNVKDVAVAQEIVTSTAGSTPSGLKAELEKAGIAVPSGPKKP